MKIKQASYALVVCTVINCSIYGKEGEIKNIRNKFIIQIEPKWEDLDKNKKITTFQDKWILAGDIIIKKLAPDFISLNELNLLWKGEKINNLIGSLYEKNSDSNFMPIEKYLICDSVWKKSEQKLILKFDKPKTLYAKNKLSLVLTIPKEMEETLKKGSFTIESEVLPEPYKEYASKNNLCLCFTNQPQSIGN